MCLADWSISGSTPRDVRVAVLGQTLGHRAVTRGKVDKVDDDRSHARVRFCKDNKPGKLGSASS